MLCTRCTRRRSHGRSRGRGHRRRHRRSRGRSRSRSRSHRRCHRRSHRRSRRLRRFTSEGSRVNLSSVSQLSSRILVIVVILCVHLESDVDHLIDACVVNLVCTFNRFLRSVIRSF